MQWKDVDDYYSSSGILPAALERLVVRSAWRFSLLDYVTSPTGVRCLYVLLLALLVLSAVGLFARVSTIGSVALLFSFHERNNLLLAGGDTVLRNLGFLLAIAPCVSACSVDRVVIQWRRKEQGHSPLPPQTMPIWPVRLLTWQLVVIYGTSVWWKLLGQTWVQGTAVAIPLHHPRFARVSPDVANALIPLTRFLTFSTLRFEAAWLLLLVPRSLVPQRFRVIPLKRMLIVSGILFHAGIFLLMDVGSFSIAMMASLPRPAD